MSIEQKSRQRQDACFEPSTAVESAQEAGLRYVTDSMPGITRKDLPLTEEMGHNKVCWYTV